MSRPANTLVVGTRGSGLALAQTGMVADALRAAHDGLVVEREILKTEGDIRSGAFGPGDRGVFVKTLERALLDGRIDFAVHSLKDLPSGDTPGLALAAVPQREDPRDVLISRFGGGLDELPQGSRVGTGSPRRRSQLLRARPDLRIESIRGNIDSRAARVGDHDLDAVVLAAAGLNRLALDYEWQPIDPAVCLPAVGQGALALQTREDDRTTIERLLALQHDATRSEVAAERAFLDELGGGCMAPATAWARALDGSLEIQAMVAALDGDPRLVESGRCPLADGPDEGRRLAGRLNERGAQRWIEQARIAGEQAAGED